MKTGELVKILVAEDDPDDQVLIRDAFKASNLACDVCFVSNGEELMDYLFNREIFASTDSYPKPDLILLDLNMPKKDGREGLAEIKKEPRLKSIPVVVLTTSRAEEDIVGCYENGANSYIMKPVKFESLVGLVKELDRYWFETVELPRCR